MVCNAAQIQSTHYGTSSKQAKQMYGISYWSRDVLDAIGNCFISVKNVCEWSELFYLIPAANIITTTNFVKEQDS